jgi:hypothetical protein
METLFFAKVGFQKWLVGVTISEQEFRDDYVTVDNILFNQNTLTRLVPTHSIGPIKYMWSRIGYDLSSVRNDKSYKKYLNLWYRQYYICKNIILL